MSNKPKAAMREHKQDPAEAETIGEDVTIDWDGVTLTLPATADDWDLDAVEAFEQGKVATALGLLAGEAGWTAAKATYQRINGRRPKLRDLESLGDAIARVYGFTDAGESAAS